MEATKTDRRVRRTRELLRSALTSLILEKGYASITVQDILDRADVGRSTFYAHFRDKDDLVRSGFEDIREAVDTEKRGAGRKVEFLQPMLAVFQHVEQHRRLKAMARIDMVQRALRDNTSTLVREHLRSQFPGRKGDETRFEGAVQFVVGAMIGLLMWWLENDIPSSAEEMHEVFRRMAAPGVKRFLS